MSCQKYHLDYFNSSSLSVPNTFVCENMIISCHKYSNFALHVN